MTASRAAALMQELTREGGAGQLALLWRLFAQLATAPEPQCQPLSERSFALTAELQHQAAIAKAVRHLIANFRDEVRLDELLRLTGMSRPTFARQFKRHAGRTVSEFLNRLRLQAACRDLAESSQGVLEIALASGFTQVSFFNRLFRREMKCSPREYRARSQTNETRAIEPRRRPA
jgi:AraC-like DNA-binding protein